jgi:hypothetical protein
MCMPAFCIYIRDKKRSIRISFVTSVRPTGQTTVNFYNGGDFSKFCLGISSLFKIGQKYQPLYMKTYVYFS